MSASRALVWLFDVDGTLLLTKGAGRLAMSLALRDRFGVDDDLSTIPFAGSTDGLILANIAARHGLTFRDGDRERYWFAVTEHMRALMDPPRGGLLPGVPAVLDALAAEPAWTRALLTGNVSSMADVKLGVFGIRDRFAWGAFGDEAPDRNELAKLAVRRAAERHGVTPDQCIVVGDTELDVACARAAGARAVAVATGGTTKEALAAAQPDLLLGDLEDAGALIRWASGGE
jgi:phosphoglycolate phosphatase